MFTIYYTLATPGAWARLRDEIRSKFQSVEQITGQALATIPFLNALIYEGISFMFFPKFFRHTIEAGSTVKPSPGSTS